MDDPSAHPDRFPTEAAQTAERERLFDIIRRLMAKRLHEHPQVYAEARREMEKYCDGKLPPVLDPFAGGGSIPLEANRLGFEAHAGDLNPVAVLLNKCNLEIAPRWLDRPPVNPQSRRRIAGAQGWRGTHGLADDVRYYGKLIRERAEELIGQLYPKAQLPRQLGGGEADVIAWIWARTVASPDPAARGAHVPLISTYWLSSKKGSLAWLVPVADKAKRTYRFEVRSGIPVGCPGRKPKQKWKDHARECAACAEIVFGTKLLCGGFKCLLTDTPIPFHHVRTEGVAGRLGFRLLAVVAETKRGRTYLPATPEHEEAAALHAPDAELETDLPEEALGFRVQNYGICKHRQMFPPRQLTTLVTLSDLVKANHAQVHQGCAGCRYVSR